MECLRKCSQCERTAKGHHWGNIQAQSEGWFIQRDGTAFCPDHVPYWVDSWRARKEKS
jgi:hypothetical protein